MLTRTKVATTLILTTGILLAGCVNPPVTVDDSAKVSVIAAQSAAAAANKKVTCDFIHKYYPNGVALSKWSIPKNKGAGPIKDATVKTEVFRKYRYLDYDKDGIICEVIHYELPDYVNLVVSPTVNKKLLNHEIEVLAKMLYDIKDYYQPRKLTAVIHTEKDGAWGDKVIEQYGGSQPNAISKQVPRSSRDDCGFAGASLDNNGDLIFYACTNSDGRRSTPDLAIIPHEVWHTVHFEVAKGVLPLWWTEGAASYFGWAYAHPGKVKTAEEEAGGSYRFDSTKAGMAKGISYMKAMANITPKQMGILMDAFDNDNGWLDRELYAHYAVGQVAVGIIVDKFGQDGVVEFYSEIDASLGPHGWRKTFENVFNMSVEEFYVILANKMNTMYKSYK